MTKEVNYTPEAEATIRARAEAGPLNLAVATALAQELGKTPRSVIAKINRMGLSYERKAKVTKSGLPVESKEKIVAEIASMLGSNMEGLEKASKAPLQAIRDALSA